MKAKLHQIATRFTLTACVCYPLFGFSSQVDLGDAPVDISNPAIIWGAETNGVTLGVYANPLQSLNVAIFTRLKHETDTTSTANSERRELKHGTYFQATNSFCGPLELRDKSGRKLPILKPEVCSSNAYPASYSISSVWGSFAGQYSKFYSGPPLPPHPVIEGRWPDICLTNYFNIKKSGEYELTIWPKIYKRSAKDRDLCERIDVPPVTIPIKWDGKSP